MFQLGLCGLFISVSRSSCHSEGSDDSEVCEWRMCREFRFFTPLRFVQNDRLWMAAFRMTGKGSYVRNDRISKPSLFKLCIPLSVHRGGRDIAPPICAIQREA